MSCISHESKNQIDIINRWLEKIYVYRDIFISTTSRRANRILGVISLCRLCLETRPTAPHGQRIGIHVTQWIAKSNFIIEIDICIYILNHMYIYTYILVCLLGWPGPETCGQRRHFWCDGWLEEGLPLTLNQGASIFILNLLKFFYLLIFLTVLFWSLHCSLFSFLFCTYIPFTCLIRFHSSSSMLSYLSAVVFFKLSKRMMILLMFFHVISQ